MKPMFTLFAAVLLVAATAGAALAVEASVAPGARPLAVGTTFPNVPLIGKASPEAAAYLGLDPAKAPSLVDTVKAEVLIVEIFSMYCPFCQKEAPTTNALFDLIDKQGLGNRIKILGIGAGNSDMEVDIFRKKYAVPFPLFSDSAFAVHQRVGEVGTPFFYILRKKPDGGFEIVHTGLGAFGSPTEFLSLITRKAGL